MDLIMLDHEGFLTFYERTWKNEALVLTAGKRIFFGTRGSRFNRRNEVVDSVYGPLQLNTDKYGSSGRRKWCFVDWDQDQDLDIIINGINAAWFENVRQNEDRVDYEFRGNLSEQKLAGHTTSPTTVDWNQDGIPELLLGAEDGHLYYFSKN